jgi:hypothetical protein
VDRILTVQELMTSLVDEFNECVAAEGVRDGPARSHVPETA